MGGMPAPAPAEPPRGRLFLYLLACHAVLLGHQLLYFAGASPEAAVMAEQARELASEEGTLLRPEGREAYLAVAVGAAAERAGWDAGAAIHGLELAAAHALLLILLLASSGDAVGRPFWTRLVAGFLLACSPLAAISSNQGLGRALVTACVLAAVARFTARELTLTWDVALLLVAAMLAGPEALVLGVVVLLWHFASAASSGELAMPRTWIGPFLIALAVAGMLYAKLLKGGIPMLPAALRPPAGAGAAAALLRQQAPALVEFAGLHLAALSLPIAIALALMWRWPLVRAAFWFALVGTLLAVYLGSAAPAGNGGLLLVLCLVLLLAQEGYAWLAQRMAQEGQRTGRVTPVLIALPLLLGALTLAHSPEVRALWAAPPSSAAPVEEGPAPAPTLAEGPSPLPAETPSPAALTGP